MDDCDVNTTKVIHVQPPDSAYHDIYRKEVENLNNGITDINKDQNLYKSHDIHRQHKILNNYLDHMALDDEFLSTSDNWHKRFTERELVTQKQSYLRTKKKVDDFRLLDRMRVNLNKVELGKLPDNDIRETHAWAMHEWNGLRGEIHPIAAESHKRINQYSDWIGVTDRYDGYRRMLAKSDRGIVSCDGVYRPPGGPDMKYIKSASEVVPMRSIPTRFNYPPQFERARQVDALKEVNFLKYPKYTGPGYKNEKSPAEWAGINPVYPGKTEYMRRYTGDKLQINRNVDDNHYTINPKPNYSGNWELLKVDPNNYRTPKTNYQIRYEWPDGKKIRIPNFSGPSC